MKLTAICTAKNEWPMIACTCLNLAHEGVDEIIVLASCSTDQTSAGLRQLAADGAPILVIDEPDGPFHHAALTTMLANLAMDRGADWIIPFDADEFLLTTNPDRTLRDVFTTWHDDASAPRPRSVTVRNYLMPRSTKVFAHELLEQVKFRAVPAAASPVAETVEAVRTGQLPFVCAPFPSKLVLPRTQDLWIATGAHAAYGTPAAPTSTDEVFIVHLPFRDPSVLDMRAAHGELLRRLGYPPTYGWQSQLISAAATTSGTIDLATWWHLNSIPDDGTAPVGGHVQANARLSDQALRLRSAFATIPSVGDHSPVALPPSASDVDAASLVRAGVNTARTAESAMETAYGELHAANGQVAAICGEATTQLANAAAAHAALVTDVDYWRERALHAEAMRAEMEASRLWRLTRARRAARKALRAPGSP